MRALRDVVEQRGQAGRLDHGLDVAPMGRAVDAEVVGRAHHDSVGALVAGMPRRLHGRTGGRQHHARQHGHLAGRRLRRGATMPSRCAPVSHAPSPTPEDEEPGAAAVEHAPTSAPMAAPSTSPASVSGEIRGGTTPVSASSQDHVVDVIACRSISRQ